VKKTLIAATLAAVTTAGAASAADLPRRAAPPLLPPPIPVFTWTGAYFGINAGYISSDRNFVNTVGVFPGNEAAIVAGARPRTINLNTDGFTAGGQVGYNYQIGNFVLGVEADAAYTDMDRTVGVVGTAGGFSVARQTLDYLGTVRGRVGIAFDRVLVYGTGGFAYGDTTYRGIYYTAVNGAPLFAGAQSRTDTGWVAGGGIEYALPTDSFLNFFRSSAVTVKAEGLYYDLGRRNIVLNPTALGAGAYASRYETNGFIARVGLNYKFGTF
jgi:outer membrane immunogenic protein